MRKSALGELAMVMACLIFFLVLCGCNDNEENHSPVAQLSVMPLSGKAPLTVNFQGMGNDQDGVITRYHFDFDDGTTSDNATPSHVFNEPGIYRVTFSVHDDKNATDNVTVPIWVWGNEPIIMTMQEVIYDAHISSDNNTKEWWSYFESLDEGDTVIIHDTLSNVTFDEENNQTLLVFVSQEDNTLPFPITGNLEGYLMAGDTLEIITHVVWVSYPHEFYPGEIWTIYLETFSELWDTDTNSPTSLPSENIHRVSPSR